VFGDNSIFAQTIEYLQQLALLWTVHTWWEEGIKFMEYTHVDDGIGAGNSFGAGDQKYDVTIIFERRPQRRCQTGPFNIHGFTLWIHRLSVWCQ
jgi:hypothetical protein